jgi:hypothetical protein
LVKQFSDGTIHQSNLLGEGRAQHIKLKNPRPRAACMVILGAKTILCSAVALLQQHNNKNIHPCMRNKKKISSAR